MLTAGVRGTSGRARSKGGGRWAAAEIVRRFYGMKNIPILTCRPLSLVVNVPGDRYPSKSNEGGADVDTCGRRPRLRGGLREGLTLVLLTVLAMAVGCDETPVPTSSTTSTSEPDGPAVRAAIWQTSDRGAAAVELTRLVARAFSDAGLRNRVKNDMRTSPFLEHKLEFASYLKGGKGGILLAKMAQHADRSKEQVVALLEDLEPLELELYMPVDEHRSTWTGGPEVIIASHFDEGQKPAAFTTEGEPYDLSLEDAPERPVMALVPVETDFDDPLPTSAVENTKDRAGRAIGQYRPRTVSANINGDLPTCTDCTGGNNIDWSELPPGLYMFDNYIDDLGESWTKGDPELEAHLLSPTASSPDALESIQCAGEQEFGQFHFDQDGSTLPAGEAVRLATKSQIEDFQDTFGTGEGQGVLLLEDDDTTCEIKMDENSLNEFLENTAVEVGFDDGIEVDLEQDGAGLGQLILHVFNAVPGLIQTADDEVGLIVKGTNQCAPDGQSRAWLIQRGSHTNGCTELKLNDN